MEKKIYLYVLGNRSSYKRDLGIQYNRRSNTRYNMMPQWKMSPLLHRDEVSQYGSLHGELIALATHAQLVSIRISICEKHLLITYSEWVQW